jgi:hypothetical protein
LKRIPEALIVWPSIHLQRFWSSLVTRKEPLLKKKWGLIDGKNYRIQKPADSELQNAQYNGWLHTTLVNWNYVFWCKWYNYMGKTQFFW